MLPQCFRQKTIWPLSLLAFRAASHALTLPRKAVSSVDPLLHYLSHQAQADNSTLTKPNYQEELCDVENTSESEYNAGEHERGRHPWAAHKDVNKSDADYVSPVQQVSVSWGDADSELSAGNMMCTIACFFKYSVHCSLWHYIK